MRRSATIAWFGAMLAACGGDVQGTGDGRNGQSNAGGASSGGRSAGDAARDEDAAAGGRAGSGAMGGLADGCALNSDCAAPLVCAYGRCHAVCEMSRDCPAGQRCMMTDRPAHVCQLVVEQKCNYNADCPQGQICAADGQCRDQCLGDRDCVAGQVCGQGACTE